MGKHFTPEDDAILLEHYSAIGAKGCSLLLFRSPGSCEDRARKLKLLSGLCRRNYKALDIPVDRPGEYERQKARKRARPEQILAPVARPHVDQAVRPHLGVGEWTAEAPTAPRSVFELGGLV